MFFSLKFRQVCDKYKGVGAEAAIRNFGSGFLISDPRLRLRNSVHWSGSAFSISKVIAL